MHYYPIPAAHALWDATPPADRLETLWRFLPLQKAGLQDDFNRNALLYRWWALAGRDGDDLALLYSAFPRDCAAIAMIEFEPDAAVEEINAATRSAWTGGGSAEGRQGPDWGALASAFGGR